MPAGSNCHTRCLLSSPTTTKPMTTQLPNTPRCHGLRLPYRIEYGSVGGLNEISVSLHTIFFQVSLLTTPRYTLFVKATVLDPHPQLDRVMPGTVPSIHDGQSIKTKPKRATVTARRKPGYSKQPSRSDLLALGVKVRDFAYENMLLPVPIFSACKLERTPTEPTLEPDPPSSCQHKPGIKRANAQLDLIL